jgi:hypothetical protein
MESCRQRVGDREQSAVLGSVHGTSEYCMGVRAAVGAMGVEATKLYEYVYLIRSNRSWSGALSGACSGLDSFRLGLRTVYASLVCLAV